jgi:predicted aminopeptidase
MFAFLLLAFVLATSTGCQTAGYYRQAVRGHFQLLAEREPATAVIKGFGTEPELSRKLALILELRDFAESELLLDPGKHYLDYVELDRRHVVWNVSTAPEFSLDSKGWWYPFLGRLTYRGYFSEQDARDYAARLAKTGNDVFVGGVDAYSTLGWFNDPILSSFIRRDDADLAELIFHELAHQEIFARGDTDFNEAFATAIAQEGVRRWLIARGDTGAIEQRRISFERETRFIDLLLAARDRLEALYADHEAEALDAAARKKLRADKQAVLDRLQADYTRMRDEQWNGFTGYDRWMSLPINNARLNTIDTYYELAPAFNALLEETNGDLEAFYHEVRRLKRMKKKERLQSLKSRLTRVKVSSGNPIERLSR